MAEFSFKIKRPCDALIDQDRFIDENPIGHACRNEAKHKIKVEIPSFKDEPVFIHLCDSCKRIMEENPERLTFGILRTDREFDELVKNIILDLMKEQKPIMNSTLTMTVGDTTIIKKW